MANKFEIYEDSTFKADGEFKLLCTNNDSFQNCRTPCSYQNDENSTPSTLNASRSSKLPLKSACKSGVSFIMLYPRYPYSVISTFV